MKLVYAAALLFCLSAMPGSSFAESHGSRDRKEYTALVPDGAFRPYEDEQSTETDKTAFQHTARRQHAGISVLIVLLTGLAAKWVLKYRRLRRTSGKDRDTTERPGENEHNPI